MTRYQEGGAGLIFTWLAFAWAGIPLFFAIVMLHKVLERDDTPYLWSGTVAGIIGIMASVAYSLAQTDLLATAVPGFPVVPEAGLIGSLLWLAWMIVLGIFLVRAKTNR